MESWSQGLFLACRGSISLAPTISSASPQPQVAYAGVGLGGECQEDLKIKILQMNREFVIWGLYYKKSSRPSFRLYPLFSLPLGISSFSLKDFHLLIVHLLLPWACPHPLFLLWLRHMPVLFYFFVQRTKLKFGLQASSFHHCHLRQIS